ncbi:molybdenum cofactor guanylyltransferase [Methanobacterium congolense]|uniref:Probable molybdenum cofactor guanylyltransferase n=1 Tax=Methanobacterium congolense TaxID=118062 RepID=A0A1D3L2H9_9EURY|nr:molybdenum cofactor guanylyltransferase [Methanobacterium congolense]SCG85765.1 putative molybdenum cofactor guanylyltransferase [Methanobacterium congolense]
MKSCIILCGGMSTRMGQDKGSMLIEGKPMILHVIETVSDIVDEIIVVLRDAERVETYKNILEFMNLDFGVELKAGLKFCTDITMDEGPLVGILTGLSHIKSNRALVLPCDSPYVSKSFILKMFQLSEDEEYDAVVPRYLDGKMEPLHSIYRKRSEGIIQKILENGFRDVRSLLSRSKVKFVDAESVDETGRSFQNMNRAEDIPPNDIE